MRERGYLLLRLANGEGFTCGLEAAAGELSTSSLSISSAFGCCFGRGFSVTVYNIMESRKEEKKVLLIFLTINGPKQMDWIGLHFFIEH